MTLGNYNVRIWHNTEGKNRGTAVEVYSGEKLLSSVRTKVHKGDLFNKAKGRKLALNDALLSAEIPRSERMEVWKSYWEKCKM